MEVKPLTTLNLIDKLCGENVKSSPWIASTSSGSHDDDDHAELDAVSTALTLHLPCCEPPPSITNKRKQRETLVEDQESSAASVNCSKRRKSGLVVQDSENENESFLNLTLGLPQFSSTTPKDHENDNKYKLLKRKREEHQVEKPDDDDESFPRLTLGHENVKLKKNKKSGMSLKEQEDDKSILSPSNVDHMKQKEKESENYLVEECTEDHHRHHHQEDRELFKIKKRLTQSDVGNLCRLLVHKSLVEEHIEPFFDDEAKDKVKSENGLDVIVKDTDVISGGEHTLRFKYLESSKSYVFNGSWIKSFVRRKKLKKDDEVGLYWDSLDSKFHFSLLAAAANQPQADQVCSIS